MTDPFTDVADELMTRATDLEAGDAPPPLAGGGRTKKHVCPYCGAVTAVVEKPTGPCPRCSMEDTPATRAATKARIGPWYVLQTRNPSAPGMKWATLLSLVSKGQVTPRSVVRGPTTHQLWKFAAHIKGLSREFNLCYSCGGEIERTANQCPHCDRLQEPPVNPDALLESRDLSRTPIQRELKPAPGPTTDLVLVGGQNDPARHRTPDDGILSAKELAAAFQLDFNPQVEDPIEPARPRAASRRPGRALAALLLLGAIAGGGVLAARPDYREKSFAWVTSTFASIRNSISPAKPAPRQMPWDNATAEKPTETLPKPAAATEEPTTPKDATPAPSPAADVTQTPAPAPAEQVQAPSPSPAPTEQVQSTAADPTPAPPPVEVAQAPKPSPEIEIKPPPVTAPPPPVVQTPAVVTAAEKPAPPVAKDQQEQETIQAAVDAPIPSDIDAQIALDDRLWKGAIRARQLNDYPLAIRCYERIKKLDPKARQTDKLIQMYLDECQAEVRAK
jgi:hypothetical protein